MNKKTTIFSGAVVSFLVGALLVGFIISFFISFPSLLHFYSLKTIVIPITEEGLKFISLLILMNFYDSFTFPFLGLGFGFMEQIIHIIIYGTVGIVALWFHVVLGLIMSFYINDFMDKSENKYWRALLLILAFMVPMLMHFAWNYIAAT